MMFSSWCESRVRGCLAVAARPLIQRPRARARAHTIFFCLSRSLMSNVLQYDLSTVVNKDDFSKCVQFRECEKEGRSLVATQAIVPGQVVLVETPWIQYLLEPECRSSLSPYYSKKLWKTLNDIVRKQEGCDDDDNDDNEDSRGSDSEEEDGEEEEKTKEASSAFCPGVPAALLAYLDICPPDSSNVRYEKRKVPSRSNFDFFYYPHPSEWKDHATVALIARAAEEVASTVPTFKHVDATDLAAFVLKIYANAHTVSFQHERQGETHSRKKGRRRKYADKWGEMCSYRMDEGPLQQSMICLMSWGSKFAHSCAPNLFLQYEPSTNCMVFRAVRQLNPGDVLSFSYLPEDDVTLGGLVCGTTVMRQAKLRKFKFFECACTRCADLDWSRGTTCNACKSDELFRQSDGSWICQRCKHQEANDDNVRFISDRETHVQQITMAFAAVARGMKPTDENTLQMMEPYLNDLLQSESPSSSNAVPPHHWTFGSIQAVLALYHLRLFPDMFGKGLASRLGMTVKGLQESAAYLRFLQEHVWSHPRQWSSSPGNPMAAFFAGWRILSVVIETVMDATQRTIVTRTRAASWDSDSDNDNDSSQDQQDEDEESATFELVAMPDGWASHIEAVVGVVRDHWLPFVTTVFNSHPSPVVNDIVSRCRALFDRVEAVRSIPPLN